MVEMLSSTRTITPIRIQTAHGVSISYQHIIKRYLVRVFQISILYKDSAERFNHDMYVMGSQRFAVIFLLQFVKCYCALSKEQVNEPSTRGIEIYDPKAKLSFLIGFPVVAFEIFP